MPARPPLPRMICGLIAAFSLPVAAQAAEIAITDPALKEIAELLSGSCSFKLKGPITAGDAARLALVLEDDSIHAGRPADLGYGTGAQGQVLCLDSPGGDDSEALALAQVIAARGIVTAVPDGARCIGACAVSFMAGSVVSSNSDGGARMPMRVLHTGGRLGFLAPALVNGDAVLDYLAGLTIAFNGIDSFTPAARFHPQLLVEMLSHRDPANPWLIATTGQAGLYDIRLAGVPPIETNEAAWMRACNNLSLQAKGWQKPTDPDLSSWAWRVSLPEEGYLPEARHPYGDLSMGSREDPASVPPFFREVLSRHHQCLIFHEPGTTPPYRVWYERVSEDSRPLLRHFDLWQTLPHYTPLATLREMERVEPADFASLYGAPPTVQAHPDLPPVTGIAAGQSLILERLNTPAGEPRGRLAIWFGPEGAAWLYPAGEAALAASYKLEGAEICLTREGGTPQCGGISHEEGTTGPTRLTLGAESFDILFLRPGDIGPLPATD